MKAINSMKLQFEGRSVNEAFSRTAVAAFVAQLDPTVEELSDIKTAVSEAVTNCIVHAYRDRLGIVYITANILPDHRVVDRLAHLLGAVVVDVADNPRGQQLVRQIDLNSHNLLRPFLGRHFSPLSRSKKSPIQRIELFP